MLESPAVVDGVDSHDRIVQAAVVDSRPRWRRLVAPGLTAVGIAAAVTYVAAIDPNQPGHYPTCPTQWFLGIDCPGCGLLRGTHALCQGDLATALDNNILLLLVIPFAVIMWIRWVMRAWRGVTPAVTAHQAAVRTRWTIGVMIAVIAFGVIRNFVPYLGSGIG